MNEGALRLECPLMWVWLLMVFGLPSFIFDEETSWSNAGKIAHGADEIQHELLTAWHHCFQHLYAHRHTVVEQEIGWHFRGRRKPQYRRVGQNSSYQMPDCLLGARFAGYVWREDHQAGVYRRRELCFELCQIPYEPHDLSAKNQFE